MTPEILPASYDAWKTTEPHGPRLNSCECGHAHEDHGERRISNGGIYNNACALCQCLEFDEVQPDLESKGD